MQSAKWLVGIRIHSLGVSHRRMLIDGNIEIDQRRAQKPVAMVFVFEPKRRAQKFSRYDEHITVTLTPENTHSDYRFWWESN